jgi:hypothetical protein
MQKFIYISHRQAAISTRFMLSILIALLSMQSVCAGMVRSVLFKKGIASHILQLKIQSLTEICCFPLLSCKRRLHSKRQVTFLMMYVGRLPSMHSCCRAHSHTLVSCVCVCMLHNIGALYF